MPDLCVQYNVGSSLKMNEPGADTLVPVSIKGLHGRPIAGQIWPTAGAAGGTKGEHQFRPRLIVVRAKPLIARQVGSGDLDGINIPQNLTAYLTRLNALMDAWVAGLEGALNSTFTLAYTPTGGSPVTRTVSYGVEGGEFEMETDEGDYSMFDPLVSFTLVQTSG